MIYIGTDPKVKAQNRVYKASPPSFRTLPESKAYRANSSELIRMTRDHDEIRRWVESRGGRPAAIIPLLFSEFREEVIGPLQITFSDHPKKENLKKISWEKFFDLFTTRRLAFLYQERTETGEPSRFNKFIKQERVPQPGRLKMAA
jgi:hypothetical protein